MKIIIVGAGRIGFSLAKSLSEEQHEVYLIEKDEKVAAAKSEKLDVKTLNGNGADPEVLIKAGVEDSDLVLAVTTSDANVAGNMCYVYGGLPYPTLALLDALLLLVTNSIGTCAPITVTVFYDVAS